MNSSVVYVTHSPKSKCSQVSFDANHGDVDAHAPFSDLSQDPAFEPIFLTTFKLGEHSRFTDIYGVSPHLATGEVEHDRGLETESRSANNKAWSGGAHSVHL